ncbi:glycosyltransferase [Marinivivus vitaminiproducens]|uniref:glycosyltransferase n=1 Tax=Marinivivus vitaminiproducens TaxID=3035935 RepID=UPI00279F6C6E|nr:glycosyltransferase family 2 protein [Geminicoccaceae bacterium SCSIO 64248]
MSMRPVHLVTPSASEPAVDHAPQLSIIVPTYNERGNIRPLLERLHNALAGVAYEVVVVDDDSPDGTADEVRALAHEQDNVRCIQRIGRRGLSSACIEGVLATVSPAVAIIDADMQHDETKLALMLRRLQDDGLDIVVGSRFVPGGGVGAFSARRLRLSRVGKFLSRLVTRADLTDPMSGFFVMRRTFFDAVAHRLSGKGFKILIDLFASAKEPVRFAEIPYTFGTRIAGKSKLDSHVMVDYVSLIADKLLGGLVPTRFLFFIAVGLFGVFVHLSVLGLAFRMAGLGFYVSQMVATFMAMAINFQLNNIVTYRDRRLHGLDLAKGFVLFVLICSVGAVANFQVAEMLYDNGVFWAMAGFLGAVVGSVWNYGVNTTLTWRAAKR